MLGVIFDTVAMTQSVPADKVERAVTLLRSVGGKDWVSASEIQSLLCLICFVGHALMAGGWRVTWTVMTLRVADRVVAAVQVRSGRIYPTRLVS